MPNCGDPQRKDQDQSYNASAYVPFGDCSPNTIAAASNIGNLSGVTITNANFTGSPSGPSIRHLLGTGEG
jgi:hypothetical protein